MSTAACRAAEPQFTLRDGDRVVLLGDTLVERSQRYGYLETELLARYPRLKLQFRNLGWSADTVRGLSRGYFDAPPVATKRQSEQVTTEKPSVMIVGYGMAESFDGPAGLPSFQTGLNELLNRLSPLTERMVLLSPISHENLGKPLPDPSAHNKKLAAYTQAIRRVAKERKLNFVDLFGAIRERSRSLPKVELTENGIHLSGLGYWYAAMEIQQQLKLPSQPIQVSLTADGTVVADQLKNTAVTVVKSQPGLLEFQQTDQRLPTPPSPLFGGTTGLIHPQASMIRLQVTDLADGRYTLFHKDRPLHTAEAREWAAGVKLSRDTPQHRQVEKLQQLVQRKNRLFFAQYRPQNITYLLGFRRYEQGQNAKELEEVAKLVAVAETKIDAVRIPATYTFVLKRDSK
jgi:lysophospholipase L1-like esterase